MSITTSQQVSRYYEQYATVDVAFTKEVIKAVGLVTKQVFVKCLGYQWPCIIYSSSMTSGKVVLAAGAAVYETIRKANNIVTLRFSFRQSDKTEPLTFFVAAKIVGFTQYPGGKPGLSFVTVIYTQRPADTLIEALGLLLDANLNSKKRREERITITSDAIKRIGLTAKETVVFVQGVPRKAILRDISFSGAKLILMGVPKFILEKQAVVKLEMVDPPEIVQIPGVILRHEPVEGRTDIAAFVVKFDENKVPMTYKMRINEYLRRVHKRIPENSGGS